MRTLDKPRERFEAIVDALAATAVRAPGLDTELLTRVATSESQNLAELERELRTLRTPLPNGVEVFAPDYEALAEFAQANQLSLEDIQYRKHVDERSGRVIFLEWQWKDISDISALANLTSLKELSLYANRIQDISALSGLTLLDELNLGQNWIQELPALSGLTSLRALYLTRNYIHDISALSGLTSLNTLWLDVPKDPASAAAIKLGDQIAALRDRGVEVKNVGIRTHLPVL